MACLALMGALACGDDTATGGSPSTGGAGTGAQGGSAQGAGGQGGSGFGGMGTGAGGLGGAGGAGGMPAVSGPPGNSFVSAGGVTQSPSYRLEFTMGQSTMNASTMKSSSYRLEGGLIGATGSLQ